MMTIAQTPIPGPAGNPLFGSLLDLQRDSLGTFLRARAEYGDVVRFTAGPPGLRRVMYGVFSAEGAQRILATESAGFRKDNVFYEEIRANVGNGLLTSQDEAYLRQRRLVQPLFTRRRVDGYDSAVSSEAAAATERWHSGATVDMADEMARFTLRAVTRILFGADIETAVPAVRRCFPEISTTTMRRAYAPQVLPRTFPTPRNRRFDTAQRDLYGVCDRIVAARSAEPERTGNDLLSLLIEARTEQGEALSAAEIRDQVLIFLLAGHETTATSLTFALHLLARHPEQQARAREETDRVLAGRLPDAEDLDRLPYLQQVIKEAMRLYPAAALIGRRAVAETEIGGVRVPAGADVVVGSYVIHRHPDHWDDPARFDPDRFLPGADADRPRYAWLPFGGGPRACIGQHLSMLESVLALAVFLQRYELAADDTDIPVGMGITLHAEAPVPVRLTAR